MRGRRLLLVTPEFHGYWRSIESAFAQLGYDAHTVRYDRLGTRRDKLHHKLAVELPARVTRRGHNGVDERASSRVLAALDAVRPDVVLTIKGDVFSDAVWERLLRTPHILWLLDERERTRFTDATLATLSPVVSYSSAEASAMAALGVDAHYVPNAYDPDVQFTPIPSDDVVFVGARYPVRERIMVDLAAAGVPVRAYGRDWSRHPVDRLRTWSWRRPAVPGHRDIPLSTAFGVMAGAAASVNIHSKQDGFAYRTFESSGVGGVQLIDRPEVAEFYDPGIEVAVYRDAAELADLARRALSDPMWASGLRERGRARTLAEHTFVHRARRLEPLWG